MTDLSHTGEVLRYVVGFWVFLLKPAYREQRLATWRASAGRDRALLAFEAAVSTLIGLGLPGFIGLVLVVALRR